MTAPEQAHTTAHADAAIAGILAAITTTRTGADRQALAALTGRVYGTEQQDKR